MASARPYPPSAQRIAEARASGHVPRPALVATAAGVVALIGCAFSLGPRCARLLEAFFVEALDALGRGQRDTAFLLLAALQRELTGLLAIALLSCFSAILFACALSQGLAFGAARSHARIGFPKLGLDRTALVLFSLGLLGAAASTIGDALVAERSELAALAGDWARFVLLLALGCALIDAALARARFFQSLWLTRREHLDEQRAAYGAPELRAARDRIRREPRDMLEQT